ncbi:GxxExxY protein [Azospirillum agricola]|uniref:GxxExxY protein n=1 Tax=Azospirillum agricola TaxID=1720247 RepID=UPI001AEB4BAD|nr:GxxExxY protein [Azospirillum agricola]MBP2232810.1 GxxExxY protein [Azospirillum agricola]
MNTDAESPADKDPLTQAIIGAAFEVANILGRGFLEAVYRKALTHELRSRGLPVREEIEFKIDYKGVHVGRYVADMIVADSIVVEIKAVDAIIPTHVGQTLNYLRASGLRKGLVLNFGSSRLGFKRVAL